MERRFIDVMFCVKKRRRARSKKVVDSKLKSLQFGNLTLGGMVDQGNLLVKVQFGLLDESEIGEQGRCDTNS